MICNDDFEDERQTIKQLSTTIEKPSVDSVRKEFCFFTMTACLRE
jgi:hypothetical protein